MLYRYQKLVTDEHLFLIFVLQFPSLSFFLDSFLPLDFTLEGLCWYFHRGIKLERDLSALLPN